VSEGSPALSPWAWVRAVLITAVLVLQMLDAIPLPELRKHHLANPVAKEELVRWSSLLTDMGRPTTPAQLAEIGLDMGKMAGNFRKKVLKPWHPLRRLTGTGQSWGLFAYPEPATGRLVVDGIGPEGTETLYSAPGGKGDALETLLEYRRIRGIYDDGGDRPRPRRIYQRFSRFVAARVFEAHPELNAVEVRLDLHPLVPPGQGEPVPDSKRHARRILRADLEASP